MNKSNDLIEDFSCLNIGFRGLDVYSRFPPLFYKGDNFSYFLSGDFAYKVPSEKGSSRKAKNLLPRGANSLPLEKITF